jgi:hypothetical protein
MFHVKFADVAILALWRNGSPAIASLVNAAIIGPYLNPYHLPPFHTDIDTVPRC